MSDEELKDKAKNDILMVLFYIGKLVEGGFVADGPKLTVDGFDIAMDLKESGWVLSKETVQTICEVYKFEPLDAFTDLIMNVQEMGLTAMTEASSKLMKDN